MQMLYDSDSYTVMQFDMPVAESAEAATAVAQTV